VSSKIGRLTYEPIFTVFSGHLVSVRFINAARNKVIRNTISESAVIFLAYPPQHMMQPSFFSHLPIPISPFALHTFKKLNKVIEEV